MDAYLKKRLIFTCILFICLFGIYYYIVRFLTSSDTPAHIQFALSAKKGDAPYSANFMVYYLINAVSYCFMFFSENVAATISACLLMAGANTLRHYLVNRELAIQNNGAVHPYDGLSLLFVHPIPILTIFVSGWWYLGNFASNIWHNTTTIFLFPFALMLFNLSLKQLDKYCWKRNILILGLVLLNITIKPSFIFVWICVYPIFLFFKYRLTTVFFKSCIPIVGGGVFILILYLVIYNSSDSDSSIIIAPFLVYSSWRTKVYMLVPNLFFSLLFPILYSVFNFKHIKGNIAFLFAWCCFIVAFLIGMLFAESGPRLSHGNMMWQIIICSWLCFYVSRLDWLRQYVSLDKVEKYGWINFVYYIHMVFGIMYLIRYLWFDKYS